MSATKSAATLPFAAALAEVRTAPLGAFERLGFTPRADLRMVAAQEDLRHPRSAEILRPRVMRIFEQTARAERLLVQRFRVADHARHKTRDRLDHDHRGKLAAAQHIIANRNFPIHERSDALINTFIATGDEQE